MSVPLNERPTGKTEESTRLGYTGSREGLGHLKRGRLRVCRLNFFVDYGGLFIIRGKVRAEENIQRWVSV